MKKILMMGIMILLLATGSAFAWEINIDVWVEDADVDLSASAGGKLDDGMYELGIAAGIDGTGAIQVEGSDVRFGDGGIGARLPVITRAIGEFYATETSVVTGC